MAGQGAQLCGDRRQVVRVESDQVEHRRRRRSEHLGELGRLHGLGDARADRQHHEQRAVQLGKEPLGEGSGVARRPLVVVEHEHARDRRERSEGGDDVAEHRAPVVGGQRSPRQPFGKFRDEASDARRRLGHPRSVAVASGVPTGAHRILVGLERDPGVGVAPAPELAGPRRDGPVHHLAGQTGLADTRGSLDGDEARRRGVDDLRPGRQRHLELTVSAEEAIDRRRGSIPGTARAGPFAGTTHRARLRSDQRSQLRRRLGAELLLEEVPERVVGVSSCEGATPGEVGADHLLVGLLVERLERDRGLGDRKRFAHLRAGEQRLDLDVARRGGDRVGALVELPVPVALAVERDGLRHGRRRGTCQLERLHVVACGERGLRVAGRCGGLLEVDRQAASTTEARSGRRRPPRTPGGARRRPAAHAPWRSPRARLPSSVQAGGPRPRTRVPARRDGRPGARSRASPARRGVVTRAPRGRGRPARST